MPLIEDNPIAEALSLLGKPPPLNMTPDKMAREYMKIDGDSLIPRELRRRALSAIRSNKCGYAESDIRMRAEDAYGEAFMP